jgi:hypothetical protein
MMFCQICRRLIDRLPCTEDAEIVACERPSFRKLDLLRKEKSRGRIGKMKAVTSDREAHAAGKVWDTVNGGWKNGAA